jgi:copper chaperone CopZ
MLESIVLRVTGNQALVCEGCERRVERLLRAVPGVGKARAHAKNQRIEVLLDRGLIEPQAMIERLGEVGCQTTIDA